jgi:outer membrane protein assembly factor BamA
MPVNGTLSFSHKASANDFWIISNTTESALTHTFNGYLWLPLSTISLFYGQKLNEEIGTTAQEINLITSGNVRIGRAGLRFNVDRRNDLAWPTGGYSLNTEVSAARFFMGGDLRYDQWRATLNTYHRFLWSSVLALQGSMASIDKIDRDSDLKEDILPFSERLWSGGAESVRGYPERGLGPRVAYHPRAKAGEGSVGRIERAVFGGSRSILMKAEARKQIVSETLGLTLFGDLGNTFVSAREEAQIASIYQQDERGAKLEDNVAWEFGDALTDPSLLWKNNYASVGMALAYLTPLGSINLAYGLPWKEPEGVVTHRYHESDYWILTGMFHLNMGATF